MKHLVVLYYILSFASGCLGLIVSFTLYLKMRSKALIGLLCFLSLLFLLVFSNFLYFYLFKIAGVVSIRLEILFSIIFFICFGGMSYLIPYLLHHLVGKNFGKTERIFFLVLGLASVIFIIIPVLISNNMEQVLGFYWLELYSIYIYLFYAVILYALVYMALHLSDTRINPLSKKILRTLFVLSVLCFPMFLIDGFWKYFQINIKFLPRYVTLTPIFFFFFNVHMAVYGAKVLLCADKRTRISDSFVRRYNITDREKQIIMLTAQGLSHREIAKIIFVSAGTVRNYLYSIYRRTGMNDKLSLIKLAKEKNDK